MDLNSGGDRPQVQAAAGRAVGSGPPSSATGAASSLPPPPPSATDAAVQTRAADSEGPTVPPPASAAAATTTGIEYPPSDEEEPPTPAQIGAIAVAHEEMEVATQKALKKTQSEDAPLPPSRIAALADKERGNDETDGKKKAAPTTEADEDSPPRLAATSPPQVQDEAIPTRLPSVDPPASRLPSADHGETLQSREQRIPIRPSPPSMMPSPDDDTDPPVSALLRDSSLRLLEATPVEDQPEIPVYDAIQVAEQTRFERNKKIIIGVGMGLLVGAVTAGVSVSSNNGSSGSNTIEPEGVVLSTARPSESSSPSDVPSLRPTLGPSQSLAPSTSLRPTTSLHPSQTPSVHPSSMPTTTPPVYCVGIDILTDEYPGETSWTLQNTVTIDGISYPTEVVLEGSPEKGRHTYEVCLERGNYEFAIFDSLGNGIESPGYYSVAFDGVVIAQGGKFESEERVSFSLPPPSPRPSESSSPSETPSPSFQPSESSPPSTYWSTFNWSRQGLGFNGDASADLFGLAVAFSADASTIAIGAPGYWGCENTPGYVKVYGREGEGSGWEQRGDTLRGEANGDLFGHSLSLSEDGTALSIGAPRHDSVGHNSGQVKVYEWDHAALDYVQIGDTLYGTASGDTFGWSLEISNGRILAVAAVDSDANGSDLGQVTIYAWDDASSNFKQRGKAIDGNAARDSFGFSVSLSENGQKLAVGAPWNDSNGSDSGQVRVFEWDQATSNYEQLGDSLIGDAAGDWFGQSVSFSRDGTTLAIGAPRNDENGQSSGQVKVFVWDGAASNFEQIGQNLYGKATDDRFGYSVVLSSEGKTLAVGADQYNTGKPGYAEVYGWDKAALEYKRHGQSLGGEACGDQFGEALALAGNGRDLAIGAQWNDRNGTDSGRVEVFHIEL